MTLPVCKYSHHLNRTTISIDQMMKITNSEHCVVDESSDLYLSWNDMKWNKFGNISRYNETKGKMCQIRYNISTIFLTGTTKL